MGCDNRPTPPHAALAGLRQQCRFQSRRTPSCDCQPRWDHADLECRQRPSSTCSRLSAVFARPRDIPELWGKRAASHLLTRAQRVEDLTESLLVERIVWVATSKFVTRCVQPAAVERIAAHRDA